MSANFSNKMVLDAASSRIDQLDVALAKFDGLGEQKTKLETDLKSAQSQEETILSNELLSHDAGATQLAQFRALLDVVKRRLENVTQKIAEGQKAVFDTGSLAMEAAFSVWAKLRENREERPRLCSPSILCCRRIGLCHFAKCGRIQFWLSRSFH